MTIWQFVVSQVQHNQFVSAGLIAAPASAAVYWLRSVPVKIYKFAKKWLTLDIRANSDMPSYEEMLRFITSEVVSDRFTRNYNYQSESKYNWEEDQRVITGRALDIGYGTHIGFFRGRLVIVSRHIDDDSKSEKFKEFTHVTIVARKKDIIERFKTAIDEFSGRARDGQEKVRLKVNSGTYWSDGGKLPMRRMNTIFSANNAGNTIVEHIHAFDDKRDWNHAKGLPHHTGILLYGPPGTGKSSLIHAAASETKRTLFYLSLASIEKDSELTELLGGNTDWSKALLVIEDFDAAGLNLNRDDDDEDEDDGDSEMEVVGEKDGVAVCKPVRKAKKGKKEAVSLSTILNVLDGLLSPDGLVVIATTNHPDRLDEALLRPGRFDLSLELGLVGKPEFEKMADLFELDSADYALDTFAQMSGAEMRSLLLKGGVPAIEAFQRALVA